MTSIRSPGSGSKILAILPTNLLEAADVFFRAEGEESPTYFLEEWARCSGKPRPYRHQTTGPRSPVRAHPLPARSIPGGGMTPPLRPEIIP